MHPPAPSSEQEFKAIIKQFGIIAHIKLLGLLLDFSWDLFSKFSAGNQNILWDDVYINESGNLMWCSSSEPVPVPVLGDFSNPSFLVSLSGADPQLQSVPIDANITFEPVCVISVPMFIKRCGLGGK